jgi:hypothetical protein
VRQFTVASRRAVLIGKSRHQRAASSMETFNMRAFIVTLALATLVGSTSIQIVQAQTRNAERCNPDTNGNVPPDCPRR